MGFYKKAFSDYRNNEQATISQCILVGLLVLFFNIGFWIDEWSTDGTVVNEVSQICFDKYEEYCCQTFEDLKQQTPDWVGHQRRSVIAAYSGVVITCIFTGVAFFHKWTRILFMVLILATCISVTSTLAAIVLFNENFSDIPGYEQQKLGASFWFFLMCLFLQVLIPALVFIEWTRTLPDRCKRIWTENTVEPRDRPSNQPRQFQDQRRLRNVSYIQTDLPENQPSQVQDQPRLRHLSHIQANLPENQPSQVQDQPRLRDLSQRIVLESRGSEILKVEGSEVTLPRTAQSYVDNFIWQKKGIGDADFTDILPGTNKFKYKVFPPGLSIQNLQVSDSGEYRCVNENHLSSRFIDVIKLKVISLQFETNLPGTNTSSEANTLPECVVCQDEARNVLIMPCRHLVLCESCCNQLHGGRRLCPICNGQIKGIIKCFIN